MYESVFIEPLLQQMVEDEDALVRIAARRVQAKVDPPVAVISLEAGVVANDLSERQAAWQTLSTIDLPAADEVIASGLRRLLSGDVAADTQLDVILAAEKRTAENVVGLLAKYRGGKNSDEVAAKYREMLVGGRADLGREIFLRRRDVSCLRCHKVDGRGGAIGPDLSQIGSDKTREYLLESIVDPSRTIAKGFEPVLLVTDEGRVHAGIVESEDEAVVRLLTPQGEHVEVEKSTIEERGVGLSAMPADVVEKLTRRDLRDLIEFLSSLRGS